MFSHENAIDFPSVAICNNNRSQIKLDSGEITRAFKKGKASDRLLSFDYHSTNIDNFILIRVSCQRLKLFLDNFCKKGSPLCEHPSEVFIFAKFYVCHSLYEKGHVELYLVLDLPFYQVQRLFTLGLCGAPPPKPATSQVFSLRSYPRGGRIEVSIQNPLALEDED